jgi:hypothetical protein
MQAYHNTYNEPQQQHWKVDIEGSLSMEHTEKRHKCKRPKYEGSHTKSAKVKVLQ